MMRYSNNLVLGRPYVHQKRYTSSNHATTKLPDALYFMLLVSHSGSFTLFGMSDVGQVSRLDHCAHGSALKPKYMLKTMYPAVYKAGTGIYQGLSIF